MYTIYAGLKNSSKHISWNEFTGSISHEFAEKQGPHCGVGWWVLDGEIVRQPNADELQAREDAADSIRIDGLRVSCEQYQYNQFRCPSNFYGLLMAVKATGIVGEKAAKCLTELDMLWSLYEVYKNDSEMEMEVEWETAGVMTYSFDQVRAEAEA